MNPGVNVGVIRDERTVAIENASYRLAYGVMSFALLLAVIYRAGIRGDASWDLLGIVVLGGLVATLYQAIGRTLALRSAFIALVCMAVAAVSAAGVILLRGLIR